MRPLVLDRDMIQASAGAGAAPRARADAAPEGALVSFRVERIDTLERLESHRAAWQALAHEALVPAPCNEPFWLLPALRHLAGGRVSVMLVWREAQFGEERRAPELVGVLACETRRAWPLSGVRFARDWRHLYSYLGTPLLHRDCAAHALAACLGALDAGGVEAILLRMIPSSGPLRAALDAALVMSARSSVVIDTQDRAGFRPEGTVEAYLREKLSRKRRKEFKRLRSRLAEEGRLEVERFATGDDVAAWARDFYALEASGWKGKAGTAIACRDHWQAFFDEALDQAGRAGDLLFWRLSLDGAPIAMLFGVKRGREAWLSKIAFDEAHAKFSPGALIIFDVMESLVEEGRVELVDSCAIPDHPMINHIWRDTVALQDVLVCARHTPQWLFSLLVRRERALRRAREQAKRAYHRFKALLKGGGK